MNIEYGYCKNCSNGCCCPCENENCYYCRRRINGYRVNNCQSIFSGKVVCFNCNRGWSNHHCWFFEKMHKQQDKGLTDNWGNVEGMCSLCNKEGTKVSFVVRYPKKNDKKQWLLLKKLVLAEDLSDCTKNTLGYIWYHTGNLGCTLHRSETVRNLIWVPTKLYQYDEWLDYMITTSL